MDASSFYGGSIIEASLFDFISNQSYIPSDKKLPIVPYPIPTYQITWRQGFPDNSSTPPKEFIRLPVDIRVPFWYGSQEQYYSAFLNYTVTPLPMNGNSSPNALLFYVVVFVFSVLFL